jgi:hypothetical protein
VTNVSGAAVRPLLVWPPVSGAERFLVWLLLTETRPSWRIELTLKMMSPFSFCFLISLMPLALPRAGVGKNDVAKKLID